MKTATIRQILTFTAVGLLFGISAGGAFAFNAADLLKLNTTGSCPKVNNVPCDLTYADLSGKSFAGGSVAGANFTGANLSNTTFQSTTMLSVNLQGANLSGTKFYVSSLSGARFSSSTTINASTDFTNVAMPNVLWINGRTTVSTAKGQGNSVVPLP